MSHDCSASKKLLSLPWVALQTPSRAQHPNENEASKHLWLRQLQANPSKPTRRKGGKGVRLYNQGVPIPLTCCGVFVGVNRVGASLPRRTPTICCNPSGRFHSIACRGTLQKQTLPSTNKTDAEEGKEDYQPSTINKNSCVLIIQ